MPAQRTSMSACLASGQLSDASALPPYTRLMPVASTPSGSTPTGHLTTSADSGPATHCTAAPQLTCPNPLNPHCNCPGCQSVIDGDAPLTVGRFTGSFSMSGF